MAARRRAKRRERTTAEKAKDCCRSVVAFVFSNVGIIALFLGYAILGAIMFKAIEGEAEQKRKFKMANIRNTTVRDLWEITLSLNVMFEGNWTELVDTKILEFQNRIVEEVGNGYDGKDEATVQWSFSGGFLYSLTVMTTIGYGNIAPRTLGGKIVTIFYTCIGFPLFLLYLSNIGSVLAQSFKWIYAKLCKCRPARAESELRVQYLIEEGSVRADRWREDQASLPSEEAAGGGTGPRPADSAGSDQESQASGDTDASRLDLATITVPISMCLIIMAVYICGGGLFFGKLEQWDFLTSCYFCFISLSTIGFGDYVPGDSIRSDSGGVEVGFVLTSMYLIFGMAIIAMCFNLMQEEVIQKVRTCAKCLGCLREDG